MPPWLTVILIVLAVVLVVLIILAVVGSRLQKKSEAAQANIREGAQTYTILVIDKKRMKLKDAGFPKIVLDQTPKYLRGSKVCVVKAKIGPKVASLMCDDKIFSLIPVKKEIKAVMNGIYIIDVKGLRGNLETTSGKKSFREKLLAKRDQLETSANTKTTKNKKSK